MRYRYSSVILLSTALWLGPGMTTLVQAEKFGQGASAKGYEAVLITGLADAKPNVNGYLSITDASLVFTGPAFQTAIPFVRMTSVSIGEVRIETGGRTGRIVRPLIPFGGGLALATVTQKSTDLLTVEYTDQNSKYHGVVFTLPTGSARDLRDRLTKELPAYSSQPQETCEGGYSNSNSVVVEPIASSGVEVPAEYRVLLYEDLIEELRRTPSTANYIRAGSIGAEIGCSTMELKVTVKEFKKGNQAVRASTGPVGLFAGKTSLSFDVELIAADGHRVFAADMSSSKRMDTESLGVAKSAAKAITKRVNRVLAVKTNADFR